MDQITAQIARVQKFVGASVMTKTELATRAGLPLTTLIGMEKAGWNPRATTLRALVRAIDYFESGGKKKARRELQQLAS